MSAQREPFYFNFSHINWRKEGHCGKKERTVPVSHRTLKKYPYQTRQLLLFKVPKMSNKVHKLILLRNKKTGKQIPVVNNMDISMAKTF